MSVKAIASTTLFATAKLVAARSLAVHRLLRGLGQESGPA